MGRSGDGENRRNAGGSRYLFDVRLPFLVLVILSSFFPYACGINHPATKSLEQEHQSITSDSSFKAEEVPANLLVDLNSALQSEFERLGIDPTRAVQSAPSGNENSVFDLTAILDEPAGESLAPTGGVKLVWSERLIGDYDQNGAVEVADVTPIARNYLSTISYRQPSDVGDTDSYPSGDPDGDGAENWRLARVDGDSNGEIGVSDISAIAQHYLESLDGYRVYRKGPGETLFTVLPNPDDPASPLTILKETSPDDTKPARYSFTDLPSVEGVYLYRVAPFIIETGMSGPVSNVVAVEYMDPIPNRAPEWIGDGSITASQGRDGRIILGWESAIDADGDEITYSIYYDDDPIPPTGYTGTLDEWLALACEPVDSTFKPKYDEETDTWSDESVTPAETLSPDDPRVLALNPSRILDDEESGITHDEIPLQVVSGLPQYCRLDTADWAYALGQPAGFPPPPGSSPKYEQLLPIDCATAIPDSTTVGSLVKAGEDAADPDGEGPMPSPVEPNLRDRQAYSVLVQASDTSGLAVNGLQRTETCNTTTAGRFDIPSNYSVCSDLVTPQNDSGGQLNLIVGISPNLDVMPDAPERIMRVIIQDSRPELLTSWPIEAPDGLVVSRHWELISKDPNQVEIACIVSDGTSGFESHLEAWVQNGSGLLRQRISPEGTRNVTYMSALSLDDGTAVVACSELDSENLLSIDGHKLVIAERAPGSELWSTIEYSSQLRAEKGFPKLQKDEQGNVYAVWCTFAGVPDSNDTSIVVSTRSGSNNWSEPFETIAVSDQSLEAESFAKYPGVDVLHFGGWPFDVNRYEFDVEALGFFKSPMPEVPSYLELDGLSPVLMFNNSMMLYSVIAYDPSTREYVCQSYLFNPTSKILASFAFQPIVFLNIYPDSWGNAIRISGLPEWVFDYDPDEHNVLSGSSTYYWLLL